MSGSLNRKTRILIILFTIMVLVVASVFMYYRYEETRIYHVNVKVTPAVLNVKQGSELPFYINASTSKAPFHMDGTTYKSGVRLEYMGLSGNRESSSSQIFGLVKFNLSNSKPDVIADWNVSVYEFVNNHLEYFTAPAGYYMMCGVSYSSAGTPGRVILSTSFPNTKIFVSGLYLNEILNLKNNTLGLEINSTSGTYTSGSIPSEIESQYNSSYSNPNGNYSYANVSLNINEYTFVKFRAILKNPQNSINVFIKLRYGVLYQQIEGYGGEIA